MQGALDRAPACANMAASTELFRNVRDIKLAFAP
jgi:hypothetical protein